MGITQRAFDARHIPGNRKSESQRVNGQCGDRIHTASIETIKSS
jgi:hypothetical protein